MDPWLMPQGFRKRLAPSHLAQVYKSGITGVGYGRGWIQNHHLEKCSPAQEILSIMEAVDDSVITDERDVINSVAFEKLCRRAYGLERAFENVWCEDDHKRPESQKGKSWKSKVQWDSCGALGPQGSLQRTRRLGRAWSAKLRSTSTTRKWWNLARQRSSPSTTLCCFVVGFVLVLCGPITAIRLCFCKGCLCLSLLPRVRTGSAAPGYTLAIRSMPFL